MGPRQQVIAGAALFSTGGVAIKLCALTAWQVAGFRSGVAALVLLLLVPAARGWTWRSLLVAIPYALTVTLFTLATRSTTAAGAIFLQDTAPLYVLFLGPWLLKERIRRDDVWFIGAILAGILLLFAGASPPAVSAPDPAWGNLLGAISGVTWAFTLIGLRWLAIGTAGPEGAPVAAAAAGNVLAAVVAAPFALPVLQATTVDWLLILYLGVFQIACAYLLITAALPRLRALEVSLLLLVEPVLNPIWAWLALDESPGSVALAGCAIILAATALRAWQGGMLPAD